MFQTSLRLVIFTAILIPLQGASASFLIIDDFEDGDIFDGRPFEWSVVSPSGQSRVLDIRDGNLYMEQTGGELVAGFRVNPVGLPTVPGDNLSVRAKFRLLSPGRIGLDPTPAGSLRGVNEVGRINGPTDSFIRESSLRPLEEDILLQADYLQNTVEYRFWRPGEPKPADPSSVVDLVRPRGTAPTFRLIIAADPFQTMAGVYRYVVVSDSVIPADFVIPEPTTAVLVAVGVACLSGFRRVGRP